MTEELKERLELCIDRISQIKEERRLNPEFQDYFEKVAEFILMIEEHRKWIQDGNHKKASLEELKRRNTLLYADILPQSYGNSYANPRVAVKKLGEKGKVLSAVYAEIRSMISDTVKENPEMMIAKMELFLEMYGLLIDGAEEENLKEAFYWFAHDYIEDIMYQNVREQYGREESLAEKIIKEEMGSDLRYLYFYQEYISEEQLKLAQYMQGLSKEKIAAMADTYTEGFRRGFEVTRKDLSIKKSVNIYFTLGMEPMIKKAMENFSFMGLKSCLFSSPASFIAGRGLRKIGYYGGNPNRQFEYDHENDASFYLNSKYMNRKLEAYRNALEQYKEETSLMAGPAVIEEFGEEPFLPITKKENSRLSPKQQEIFVEYQRKAKTLLNEYVRGEERSFTIIAFPTPAIGENFEEIFDETIALNTLDNQLYETYQQKLIDLLDQAEYVRIRGKGKNHTEMKVSLWELKDPLKETKFENCVADVNIPVGEVFTSPKLTGTNGILHVTKVFLNGLEYRDLEITFRDGMISEYGCKNFEEEEENKKLIKEKLLGNRDTLPLGEFAIGTNTTAYQMARKWKIEHLLPILIAEKTGPHFAIGDTCYCMEEEVASFNPDGKQIAAKENERSALRKSKIEEAYFQCHTDITLPYDEVEEVTAVTKEGREEKLIFDGRFVVKGLEELNKPFD